MDSEEYKKMQEMLESGEIKEELAVVQSIEKLYDIKENQSAAK